ncbi:MAG: hypothetical protein E7620_04640 [Ruminococcaceae bacterium]|nr:hypothetical protein [Oscillospiraceae bacterium]
MIGTVREGYRLLMRICVELALPTDRSRIAEYYRSVGEGCRRWAEEVTGERLRQRFLSMTDERDRCRLRAASYRMRIAPVYREKALCLWLCEAVFTNDGKSERRRSAQLWNTEEETAYPREQALRLLWGDGRPPRVPFAADGFYPDRGGLLFFRNPRGGEGEQEWIGFKKSEKD